MNNTSEIEYIPLEISEEQKENLAKLADHLEQLPADYDEFSMADYVYDPDNRRVSLTCWPEHAVCGTIRCAAGHGPAAGIVAKDMTSWANYLSEAFVGEINKLPGALLHKWLFSGEWAYTDNTIPGVIARIRWTLANGLAPVTTEKTCAFDLRVEDGKIVIKEEEA